MFGEKLKVDKVLGPGRNLLVADHMFEPNEGESVDDLGSVDQLVDVEVSVRPAPSDGHAAIEAADDHGPVWKRNQLSNTQGSFPCATTADYIQVVRGFDDPPHDQRSASEHREVTHGEIKRPQQAEEVVGCIRHGQNVGFE